MSYIQGGAHDERGNNFPSKKALREAVARGDDVSFYPTSAMGPQYDGFIANMPADVTLTVVGPDPYTKRSWYASVKHDRNGTVKVT